MDSAKRVGVNCKFFGLWLLATSAILVYAETAPSVSEPGFIPAIVLLVLGVLMFYFGCFCCQKSRERNSGGGRA